MVRLRVVVGLLLAGGAGAAGLAARQTPDARTATPAQTPIKAFHVRGPIYLLTGGGANVVASVGPDGVLLVDTGEAQHAGKMIAAIEQLQRQLATSGVTPLGHGALTRASLERARVPPMPPRPLRYILNTSALPDHVGGNLQIVSALSSRPSGSLERASIEVYEGSAIFAHENVLGRMSRAADGQPALPPEALPTLTYRSEHYKIQPYFNGEGVQMVHRPAAATDGDTLVWFRGSDVIAAGEIFSTTSYPRIDLERGGSIEGEIAALNAIMDLAFPEYIHQGGTLVIPAYGRVADFADVTAYRDMVTIVRDRIRDMVRKGMTLEQIKAARPTADYDPRYVTASDAGAADRFVDVVFRSLPR
jgi:glyoxylase-like metal-dependent hydrolase (beta-lactamase superfamily II)